MELTKKDLLIILVFVGINQFVAVLVWYAFNMNCFISMFFGAFGGFYGGYWYYRNKKSKIQKQ